METRYKVIYYISPAGENPVKKYLNSLQKIQKAKVFRIFQNYQEYGITSIVPHTKKLINTTFWELRILGRDNIRILYLIYTKDSIFVIHGFTKKSQKTPTSEIHLASKRYEEWKKRY